MKIPLVNLLADCKDIQVELEAALVRVARSGRFILGDEVTALEKELADWNNSRFAIGVASGTDALLVALMALDLKPGDEVITTPFTFIATVEAIVLAGGKPVLVDINESDMNINPALIEKNITPRTRAMVPVHLYGCPCDMDAIMALARKHNLTVIEDLAQALGAEWKGTHVGNFGAINCVSFFPAKNLGAMGDAGAVLFNDESYRDRLLALRQHGSLKRYFHEYIGVNARIDEMQAAILRIKLKKLDEWTVRRRRIAALYREKLSGLPLRTQQIPTAAASVYNQFTIVTDRRDELMKYLETNGIPTAVHYPLPLHQQPALKSLGYLTGDLAPGSAGLPVSEKMAGRVLSLPIYPSLADDQVAYICDCIRKLLGRS